MKTTRRPMWMRLSAVIIAISMLMCIFAGCQKKEEKEKTPMEFLREAINNTLDTAAAQVEETEISDFCGSAEVKLNLAEIEMLKDYMAGLEGFGIEASAKVYLDTAKPAAALTVAAGGSGLQIIDALMYLDQSNLALDLGGMLLDGAYGINLEDFEENFDSSVFGPDGAYSLGYSYDELVDMIGEVTTALETMPEIDEELEKKAEAALDVIPDTLLKSIEENCEVTKESGSVKLGDTELDTDDVVVVLDAVAAIEVIEDMMTLLRDDENIRAIMEYYFDVLGGYVEAYYLEITTAEEYYDTIDEFFAEIDDMKADAAEEEGEVELTFHVNADENELIGISMDTIDMEEPVDMEILWGPSVEEFNTVSLVADIDGEKTEALFTIDEENTDSKYKATVNFELNSDYEEIAVVGGVEWDKTSGAAAVYMEMDGEELRAEANIKVEGEKINIALGKITVPYEEPIDLTGVYITINKNDVMPTISEYTDLLTMTEAEFDELIMSIYDLIGMFG